VSLPHRAVVNFLRAMAERPGLGANGRLPVVPALTTLTFDIAALEIYLPLALGGRIEVVRDEERTDGRRLAALLEAAGATAMQATPATWRLLVETGWRGRPGLVALCGGEALPCELAAVLLARGLELWNVYGPTETAVWSSVRAVGESELTARGTVSLGRPIANTRFLVVDERLEPVPMGAAGELLIGGDGVARGYWRRPELTAERFVPDASGAGQAGSRLYRSGDLVRHRPDGGLEFLGRIDHQVKLRGFRIELGEIEAVLAAHPRIAEVAVVSTKAAGAALHEQEAGAGSPAGAAAGQRLVAYVVGRSARMSSGASAASGPAGLSGPAGPTGATGFSGSAGSAGSAETGEPEEAARPAALAGAAPAADELRAYLAAKLPSFMVPWAFVPLPALPRNANGKLDRAALPDPGRQAWGAAPEVEEPRSEAERTVAAIWQEVLGLDRVSVHDNFFDSGGHSLLAVRAYHRYRAAFGRDFPLIALFENPTIEALARFLGRSTADGEDSENGENGAASRQVGQERGARRRELAARRRAAAPAGQPRASLEPLESLEMHQEAGDRETS